MRIAIGPLLGAAALVAGLAGPGLAADPEYVLKLGSPSQPADTNVQAYFFFERAVEARSDGRIDVQVFHSGQLGDQRDYLESMRMGSLQAGEVTTSVMSTVAEEFEVFNLPYLARSMDHLKAVLDGGLAEQMNQLLQNKAGLRIVSWFIRAPRSIYSARGPINTPDDFAGLKIRVMESPVMVKTFEILGATPVPIAATERYMALQTGVVDAAENSPPVVLSEKEYEVTRYVSLTEHFLSPNVLVMDNGWYGNLPEDLQTVIDQSGREAGAYEFGLEVATTNAVLDDLRTVGMEVNTIEDKTPFVEKAKAVYAEYEDRIGKDLIEQFLK
ncbi:MAG TPA: TRAP transporter substrate-binding protein [Geminicoccaceae bacterium]|nr:TRAP transporter substrate-binding protein [Geminicoccaceae bacterium]